MELYIVEPHVFIIADGLKSQSNYNSVWIRMNG